MNNYDDKLELSRKNSFTEQQKAADEAFDETYVHAHAYARVMPYFPVKAAAEAGAKNLAIFEKYGNITELGYTEEYAKAHNLTQDLDGLGTEVLTAANFTPWFEALTTGYAQFTVLRESKLRILLPSLVQRRKHARLPKKHTTSS